MSGGVDSSVSAALLVRQGFDVTGGFIKNWSDTKDAWTGECNWRNDRRDAMRVAALLDIPLISFDFEASYREKVVEEMFKGYEMGETPNPDVLCNQYIKFGLFWDKAKELGFDLMATGHYATRYSPLAIRQQTAKSEKRKAKSDEIAHLYRGFDKEKDQSYFLYRISQESLAHTLFPVGEYTKPQVRDLARKFKLPVAERPDSQGICFIGKIDFSKFLGSRLVSKPGDIITADGKVIGKHAGLYNYTIGQRQRIGVAGDHPWYVAGKDMAGNRLIVVESEEHPFLQAIGLEIENVHWISGRAPKLTVSVQIQARYRQEPNKGCILKESKNRFVLELDTPIKAAAIGQSAVIYKNNECLGGGMIRSVTHS